MGEQAPANTPFLGMGRPTFDRASFEADGVPASVIEALMHLQGLSAAMGYAGAAEAGQTEYQNVVARFIDPDWVFYGARPDTPLTPDTIPGLAGGGDITVERDNTLILAAATTLNFSTNFSVVDAGGGQVDVDVTGGGGTTYTASTPLVISGGNDISLTFGFGLIESSSTLIADIGDGLEADSNKFRVKAHTYIDVTASGVAVDFTEVADYFAGSDQYLRNNSGTFQWATLPTPDGVGYDEIQEEGTPLTKRAKINFIGSIVTATDDAANGRTNITFGSASSLAIVMIRTTVPAAVINGVAVTSTPGVANNGATVMTESGGALSSSGTSIDAVNFSLTAITHSSTVPGLYVAMRTTWNGDDAAILIGPFDMRSLPGFISGDAQVPYHAATVSSFVLGGGEC